MSSRLASLLLAPLFVFSPDAGAKEIRRILGPVRLEGRAGEMHGPFEQKSMEFETDGWLRGLRISLLDSARTPTGDWSVFCHAGFISSHPGEPWYELTHDQGRREIRFPEGFGVPLASLRRYVLDGMLQSDDPKADASYYFDFSLDVAEKNVDAPLTSLRVRRIDIDPRKDGIPGEDVQWHVPPGEHRYTTRFKTQEPIRVHYMQTHVHRYVKYAALSQGDTTIYRANAVIDEDRRLLNFPVYSEKEGLVLKPGKDYDFTIVYDNPTENHIHAMGALELFFVADK